MKFTKKIDSFMEFSFKFLCFVVSAAIVAGLISSCCAIPAAAISVDDQTKIDNYLNTFGQNLNALEIDWSQDEDGNRNTKLTIYSLQKLALENQESFYSSFSVGSVPDTMPVSGSAGSGLFLYTSDNTYHNVFCYKNSAVIARSDLFSITVENFNSFLTYQYNNTSGLYGCTVSHGQSSSVVCHDTMGFFSGSINAHWAATDSTFSVYAGGGIPSYSGGSLGSYVSSTNAVSRGICGNSQNIVLPVDSVDSSTPWDYYNDKLLPYIRDNYDIPNLDDFLVFPDGYSVPTDPIEPDFNIPIVAGGGIAAAGVFAPVIIGAGAIINVDLGGLNFDFDVFAPIDSFLKVDGLEFQFPVDNSTNKICINRQEFDIPFSAPITIDNKEINFTDLTHFTIDDVPFVRNLDGTITINDVDYTLPIGTPTTVPSEATNYIYEYEIPTLEQINIVDYSLSPVDLSAFSNGLSFLWGCIARFYYDAGLAPALLTSLALAAFAFALSKIGGA